MLSPYLFTRYVRDLVKRIAGCGIGCAIGNVFMNLFVYEDDMVLLSPSWNGMQRLLSMLEVCCNDLDIICNIEKTVCMFFSPKCRRKIIANEFPVFVLNGQKLMFVSKLISSTQGPWI